MKLTKIMASILITVSVLTLNPIGASAAWRQDSTGWWYTEGNSWATGWRNINGSWYYFYSDGYMAHDTNIGGYKLDSNGAWIVSTPTASTETAKKGYNIIGQWNGTYTASQGETNLKLVINSVDDNGGVDAVFNFSPTTLNYTVPSGSFKMKGIYYKDTNVIQLKGVEWINKPVNYEMVNIAGNIDTAKNQINGKINNFEALIFGTFQLQKVN